MVLSDQGNGRVEFIVHALLEGPDHVDDLVNVSHEKSDIHKAVDGDGAKLRIEVGLGGHGQIYPGAPREIIAVRDREAVELADKYPYRVGSKI